MPTPSLVNWTSHHKTTSGTLIIIAKLYASVLESGNNPENPPRAITRGGLPAIQFFFFNSIAVANGLRWVTNIEEATKFEVND